MQNFKYILKIMGLMTKQNFLCSNWGSTHVDFTGLYYFRQAVWIYFMCRKNSIVVNPVIFFLK